MSNDNVKPFKKGPCPTKTTGISNDILFIRTIKGLLIMWLVSSTLNIAMCGMCMMMVYADMNPKKEIPTYIVPDLAPIEALNND